MGDKYCDEYVCLFVCLFVCLSAHITRKPHGRTSPDVLCMLPVAVARSSSDSAAIRYVLPVLRMTSCFHTMGPVGQNQARRCLDAFARWRYQLDVRQLQCLVEFVRICGTGGKVCDLRLLCVCTMQPLYAPFQQIFLVYTFSLSLGPFGGRGPWINELPEPPYRYTSGFLAILFVLCSLC